jgi:phosphatidylserine decarboxylase
VRRIEAYVREGQQLELGQRIGMIKFGSQVDVFIPAGGCCSLSVTEGQVLVAGETVIGRVEIDQRDRACDQERSTASTGLETK